MGSTAALGRDAELAEVDAFLAELPEGSAALALEGEPGIGKTTVWQEAVDRARAVGLLVLACRPAAAEAKLSFAGLGDMLAGIHGDALAPLPEPQRHALEVALLRAVPGAPSLDPRLVGTALLSLLRALGRERPVLLAVDDEQWLDAPTSGVLTFAARRLDEEPVGVLCAFRPRPAGRGMLDSVERERVRHVRLAPLELDPLRRMIRERLGRSLPRPLVARIAESAHGNPFYALEVARMLPAAASAADGARLPVPQDVRELAESRVRALPAETRQALLKVAVLAAPRADWLDLRALAPAEAAGLVRVDDAGAIEFSHPLFAAAINACASAAERQAAHLAAAAAVPDPEQRARHLAIGTEAPQPAVAAELDAAADLARARGAPDAAAALVELALRHTPPRDSHLAPRTLAAAELHAEGGDLDLAQTRLAALLDSSVPAQQRARALQLRAMIESQTDSFAKARDTSLQALEAAAGQPALQASIGVDTAFYLVSLGDVPGSLRHAEAAFGRASLPGSDLRTQGDALAVVIMVRFLNGDGVLEERLERALELEDHGRRRWVVTSPRYISGLLLFWTGRLREGLQTLLDLRAERLEHGMEGDVASFTLYLVWAYLWLGETDRAAEVATADAAAAQLLGEHGLSTLTVSARALVHAHRGDLEAARADAEQSLQRLMALQFWSGTVWPRWALGFAELSAGNPAAAHEALEPLTRMLPGMGMADPVVLMFLPDEIEALIALGELGRAEQFIELLQRLGVAQDRAWAKAAAARGRGLLATARGQLDEAVQALGEALAEHDRVPMPFERARTLLALGRARRRRKQWGPARNALREAQALFEQSGTPLWTAAARSELARAGEGTEDPLELSPTERRVAELAASGLTNQEVAERVFLTVKGVEANLTRIYRKLGIRSRGGLARALRSEDDPVAS